MRSRALLRVMRMLRRSTTRHLVAVPLALVTTLLLFATLVVFVSASDDDADGGPLSPAAAMPGVTELTDDNFDTLVGNGTAAFVEFYAPWCGHCKRLARDYALLGKVVHAAAAAASAKNNNSSSNSGHRRRSKHKAATAPSRLLIGKVDATQQRALAERYAIRSFPTLLYFDAATVSSSSSQQRRQQEQPQPSQRPEEYRGGRSVEDMARYLDAKTSGTRRATAAAGGGDDHVVATEGALLAQLRALVPDEVQQARELTSSDFARVVGNASTSTLVLFYAPWCAYCAAMKPTYNTLTQIFAHNDDVVIARIDATAAAHATTVAPYKITSFPTLYLVPHGDVARARRYRGSTTSVEQLVHFVNQATALPRLRDGSVSVRYGTDATLRKQLVKLRKALLTTRSSDNAAAVAAAVQRVKDDAARLRDARVAWYYAHVADTLVRLASDVDMHDNNNTAETTKATTRSSDVAAAWRAWQASQLAALHDAASDQRASAARDEAQIQVNILQYLDDLSH